MNNLENTMENIEKMTSTQGENEQFGTDLQ